MTTWSLCSPSVGSTHGSFKPRVDTAREYIKSSRRDDRSPPALSTSITSCLDLGFAHTSEAMPGLRAFSTSLLALVAVAPGAFADFFGPNWFLETDVHIQRLAVTMKVPAIPSNLTGQTLFIWPGIQPGNALDETNGDPAGVGNGVLQPVLTWGLSCAPGTQPDNQWWISAQYVNTYTSNSEFSGCFGGDLMALQPDDLVECTMELENGTVAVWNQTCVNQSNDESVSFQFDLDGQLQSWGELIVETTNEISLTNWDFPAFFYNLEFTTDNVMAEYTCIIPESDPGYVSKDSALSADGLTCTLGGIGVFNPSRTKPEITDEDLTLPTA